MLNIYQPKFARKCYQIMLGTCQVATHITNTDLYHMADEHLILEMIRECQFTGHCLCMPEDEPDNIYVIHQSKLRQFNQWKSRPHIS